ncbi:protein FIP1-like isoform X4 [Silene latifolia]|uniref:protein FIP1-like isoform X4 n=2 Tax=Silene latifolia TaxID=37657 RepID=UPI003D771159
MGVYSTAFYWLCHSWDSSSMDFSSSSTMDLTIALQLQCYPFNNHRNLSAVSGLPSTEDSTAGLLHVQPEIETYCPSTLCHCFLRNCWNATFSSLGTQNKLSLCLCTTQLILCHICRIVMLVEVVIAATFMSAYIGYVHQYNSLDSQPDVLKSLYSPLQSSSSLEGLRYYDGRLADQQMALLQYQRENIHFLCEEILRLQECLSKYETSNDGNAPQVDLAHLLAARDQELRTLSAEMDQLQSELQLARSVIAEKDAETQRIRITNNQYIEENERLRAILGEWSTRAAKLERALEEERMSNLDLQKKISRLKNQSSESTQQNQKH